MGKAFKAIVNELCQCILEVVYPRENYCIICNEEDCFGICDRCRKNIKIIKDCYQEEIISYGYYGGILKDLILKFKYKGNFTAGDLLAELLEEYICNNIDYKEYILAYIPLSKKAQKARGFSQCEYLAKKISRDLSIDILEILIKDKETKEQKTLRKDGRAENIKGAFNIKKGIDLKSKRIILIDDVTTTGATIKEGRKMLEKCGIKEIKLLTLAKSNI